MSSSHIMNCGLTFNCLRWKIRVLTSYTENLYVGYKWLSKLTDTTFLKCNEELHT